MTEFISGLDLSGLYFKETIKPILDGKFPNLKYSAALIGHGSEVLRFDTEMSRDHDWGPRMMLFLEENNFRNNKKKIDEVLKQSLPLEFHGYSTHFVPNDDGTRHLEPIAHAPVEHLVEILTKNEYFSNYLGLDMSKPISPVDWLTFPQQKLLGITSGAVFHDEIGLNELRKKFSWYPKDVWLYLLASLWQRIGQEEHLMGRAGYVGDELGASIIASRVARDLMRLSFLLERKYAPYPKWFGSAFMDLRIAPELQPELVALTHSQNWQERQNHYSSAIGITARYWNKIADLPAISEKTTQFYGRPFQVINGGNIAKQVAAGIKDEFFSKDLKNSILGSIDLISDNTDLVEDQSLRPYLLSLLKHSRKNRA